MIFIIFIKVSELFVGELEFGVELENILFAPWSPDAECDADESDDEERDAEALSHAQAADAVVDLVFFEEFDEEAHAEIERDDEGSGEAEGARFVGFFVVEVHGEHDDGGDDAHTDFEEL